MLLALFRFGSKMVGYFAYMIFQNIFEKETHQPSPFSKA